MQIWVGKTHNSYLIKESENCDRKTETLVSLEKTVSGEVSKYDEISTNLKQTELRQIYSRDKHVSKILFYVL